CELSLLRSDLRFQCELGFYPVRGLVPRNTVFFTAFTDEVCLELNFLECRVLDFLGASDVLGRFLGSALSLHNWCWSASRHRCRHGFRYWSRWDLLHWDLLHWDLLHWESHSFGFLDTSLFLR